jgi:hypothetical protein
MREKLIELLSVPIYPHEAKSPTEVVADYLLDNGVTIQKWIPLSERKPNRDELVLVFFEGMRDTNCAIQVQYGWCLGGSASHWMPLPEPPKEERQ